MTRIFTTVSALGFISLVALMFLSGMSNADKADDRPWMVEEPEVPFVFDEHCCTCDDCEANGCPDVGSVDRPESEISKERMVKEVQLLWEMWFDDEGASPDDSRRLLFEEYANDLVDAVMLYQDIPTDIGGQLPRSGNDHLIQAFWAVKESSLIFNIKADSPREEVCLMQLHGKALAGFDPEKVRNNPRLCLMLGARWIAYATSLCRQPGVEIPGEEWAWELSDWTGVMSAYSGGEKAKRSDGTCYNFEKMKERIDQIRMYRVRIDHELELWDE